MGVAVGTVNCTLGCEVSSILHNRFASQLAVYFGSHLCHIPPLIPSGVASASTQVPHLHNLSPPTRDGSASTCTLCYQPNLASPCNPKW